MNQILLFGGIWICSQESNHLSFPIQWYNFNGKVCLGSPTNAWMIPLSLPPNVLPYGGGMKIYPWNPLDIGEFRQHQKKHIEFAASASSSDSTSPPWRFSRFLHQIFSAVCWKCGSYVFQDITPPTCFHWIHSIPTFFVGGLNWYVLDVHIIHSCTYHCLQFFWIFHESVSLGCDPTWRNCATALVTSRSKSSSTSWNTRWKSWENGCMGVSQIEK